MTEFSRGISQIVLIAFGCAAAILMVAAVALASRRRAKFFERSETSTPDGIHKSLPLRPQAQYRLAAGAGRTSASHGTDVMGTADKAAIEDKRKRGSLGPHSAGLAALLDVGDGVPVAAASIPTDGSDSLGITAMTSTAAQVEEPAAETAVHGVGPRGGPSPSTIPCYYINLDRSVRRRRELMRMMRTLGNESWTRRVPAVGVLDLPKYSFDAPHCDNHGTPELACLVSHLRAIHAAYHEQWKEGASASASVLVLEDDARVLRWPRWDALLATAPAGWQLLRLYVHGDDGSYPPYADPEAPLWLPNSGARGPLWGALAYVISRDGMRRLLDTLVPGATSERNWEQLSAVVVVALARLGVRCLADAAPYAVLGAAVWNCTAVFFGHQAVESTIHMSHVPAHARNVQWLSSTIRTRGHKRMDLVASATPDSV